MLIESIPNRPKKDVRRREKAMEGATISEGGRK
jgi:hypothetical protein